MSELVIIFSAPLILYDNSEDKHRLVVQLFHFQRIMPTTIGTTIIIQCYMSSKYPAVIGFQ